MADWRNDDLLLTESQRNLVEAQHPGSVAVLDFPDLRTLFHGFDQNADQNRRRRHRTGLLAITTGGLGAALAAILPIAETFGVSRVTPLLILSAVLSIGGLMWGVILIFRDPRKEEWLCNRLRTERLRQFYFQFLLSDPTLAANALAGGDALKKWQEKKEVAVRAFKAWLGKPMHSELTAIKKDINDRDAWLFDDWRSHKISKPSAKLDIYFAILRSQRIDVQRAYIREKVAHGLGSPETRLRIAQILAWTFTIATAFCTAGMALVLSAGYQTRDTPFTVAISAIALLGVLSIYVRVIAEGLHLRGDTERYRWYDAAIDDVELRFSDSSPQNRLDALRLMEQASYRELREFLTAHDEAVFNIA